MARAITGDRDQPDLFVEDDADEAIPVRLTRIRLERGRTFGDVWLGWTLWRALRVDDVLAQLLPDGREAVPWATMAALLVLARLCEPSSELHIAETWYRGTALEDLLALPAPLVNDDRLYRALDRLLPHKPALEQHLVARLGELFALDYEGTRRASSSSANSWPSTDERATHGDRGRFRFSGSPTTADGAETGALWSSGGPKAGGSVGSCRRCRRS